MSQAKSKHNRDVALDWMTYAMLLSRVSGSCLAGFWCAPFSGHAAYYHACDVTEELQRSIDWMYTNSLPIDWTHLMDLVEQWKNMTEEQRLTAQQWKSDIGAELQRLQQVVDDAASKAYVTAVANI